jgi:DNA-directed RNA polymerase subunit RPC12/RpoP
MVSCSVCGLENLEGSKFCFKCGALLEKKDRRARCPSCGTEYGPGATVCGRCGQPFDAAADRNRTGGKRSAGPASNQFASAIVTDILLSLVTCGVYQLFWQARQMKALNYLLGEERFSFLKWLLLTLVTCGIYHIYYEYVMARSINEVQLDLGIRVSGELPLLSVLLSIFGISIAADAIQQHEINKICGRT